MNDSINARIQARIKKFNSAHVFSASDFSDLADNNTVRQTLSRLEKNTEIKRIMRGFYHRPAFSKLLNEYEAPIPHKVAEALARKHRWSMIPSGTTALNMLGLSTQVPAKWSFISSGPYREFSFGNISIEFKHHSSKEISGLSQKTALVIQAIRALGKDRITPEAISRLKSKLSDKEKAKMATETRQTTAWVHQIIRKIIEKDS